MLAFISPIQLKPGGGCCGPIMGLLCAFSMFVLFCCVPESERPQTETVCETSFDFKPVPPHKMAYVQTGCEVIEPGENVKLYWSPRSDFYTFRLMLQEGQPPSIFCDNTDKCYQDPHPTTFIITRETDGY